MMNSETENEILEALKIGNLDLIQAYVLDQTLDVNYLFDESSVLGWAASYGHLNLVQFLFEQGAAVNLPFPFEEHPDIDPPIVDAINGGNLAVVKLLVEAGADVNEIRGNQAAIAHAAESRFLDIFNYLEPLSDSVFVEQATALLPEATYYQQREDALTDLEKELIHAVRRTDLKTVRRLIPKKVNVNVINEAGYTPLMYAVEKGKYDTTKILLRAGADPNRIGTFSRGTLPIIAAVGNADVSITKLLLKEGAEANVCYRDKTVWTVMVWVGLSLRRYLPELIDVLVAAGADINFPDSYGNTPLMLATFFERDDFVDILTERGASAAGLSGVKLLCASQKGDRETIETLLQDEPQINVNAQDFRGRSALISAVCGNHFVGVEALVNAGCDLDLADQSGQTPLMIAINFGYLAIAKYLLQSGANRTLRDHNGHSALDYLKGLTGIKKRDRTSLIRLLS